MAETKMLQAVSQLQSDMNRQLQAQTSTLQNRIDHMEMQMEGRASQMTELHAQNQLLLSKISALSSQNSNAPGIFDGADRRKLEAKQKKLRENGQKLAPTVRRRQLAFFDMEYPMWLVPVGTLLQFEHLPSHQQALAKGMLVQYTSEIAGRVIFVSHEWLSLGHADPHGEQLRELQRLLIRMMKGEVNAQHPKVKSITGLVGTAEPTCEEWAVSLPFSFIWLDFLSIPQPSMEEDSEASGHGTLLDHGMSSASKSAHQLALAVNSIPAYARASSLMLVLTPFIRHKDRGNICSFQSWRKRGWCRLEVMAAYLATHDLRVITCNGGEATPSYIRMQDIGHLIVGRGNFTCCACDHDFGTGVKVRCDKTKVWPVLARMFNDSARHFKQNGEIYVARTRLAATRFLEGLVPPPDADFSLSYGRGSLSDWKQRLWYGERGDDWEAQFKKGWDLLHALVPINSLQAVQEYVNQPSFQPSEIIALNKPYREYNISAYTPLMISISLPSFDIAGVLLQKLDEAGLREKVPHSTVFGPLGYQRNENLRKWLQLFPSHATPSVYTHYCRLGDAEAVKVLMEAGADIDEAKDALHVVAQNYGFGGEVAACLLSVASPGLINKVKQAAPPIAPATAAAAVSEGEQPRSSWLGRLLLPKKAHVLPAAQPAAQPAARSAAVSDETDGDSPLHSAIRRSNIGVMIAPDGANADLSLRNAKGLTASELVKQQYNNTTPPVLSELLRSAAYYNASAFVGGIGGGGRGSKRGGGRSAEITRTEMEDTIRTMADTIKAKDEAMRAKDEQVAEAMRAKDEAMRTKDEAMKAKDEQVTEAMKAKDEQIADALRAKDEARKAKDQEFNNTIKAMAESMRAMEQRMNALQSAEAIPAGLAVAGLGSGAPTIADIAL